MTYLIAYLINGIPKSMSQSFYYLEWCCRMWLKDPTVCRCVDLISESFRVVTDSLTEPWVIFSSSLNLNKAGNVIYTSGVWHLHSVSSLALIVHCLSKNRLRTLIFCWTSDNIVLLLWRCFDSIMQRHKIYFRQGLHSFLAEILNWQWQSRLQHMLKTFSRVKLRTPS